MKVAPSFNYTVVEATDKSLKLFAQQLKQLYENLAGVINGHISFGDGTNTENIDGNWVDVITPATPDTDFTVEHNLLRLPVGYLIMQKDRAVDVYQGSIPSTTTEITLRATVASAVIKLFIIGLLLAFCSVRSDAQGAAHFENAFKVVTPTGTGLGFIGPVIQPIPGATVTVCNGTTLPVPGNTCVGLANLFSNVTLTTPISNPTSADIRGNYAFFAVSGQNYVVSVAGTGLITYSYVWTAPFAAGGGGIGSVTSVGLSAPVQFSVSGTPVTTSGTLGLQWIPAPPNTFLGGPAANTISGVFDGSVSGISPGPATTLALTLTPGSTHDLAVFAGQGDVVVGPTMTGVTGGPGSWSSQFASGSSGVFTQLLATGAPLTGTASFSTPAFLSGMMIMFRSNGGSPLFVQNNSAGGAITNGQAVTFGANTVPGNSILVILQGDTISAPGGVITDSQGNLYTSLGTVTNSATGPFNQTMVSAWLASGITGATHDVITYNTNSGFGTSGSYTAFEISGLAVSNALPGFRQIFDPDLQATHAALAASPLVNGMCVQATAGGKLVTVSGPCGTSSGFVTTTGSPVATNLAVFSGPGSITNGDLSGDCTTAGNTVVTCTKINGNVVPIFKAQSVSGCTTSGASYAGCTVTLTWTAPFADALYSAACSGVTSSGFPYIEGITAQSAASITIQIRNGTSNGATSSSFGSIKCIGVHP
jgi:hypothetical protein